MLHWILLLTCGVALGASTGSSSPPGDPPPADKSSQTNLQREGRSGLSRDSGSFSWPDPDWRTRQVSPEGSVAAAPVPHRMIRFNGGDNGFQPSQQNLELARDYRFEPYYRQDLSGFDKSRDRDIYSSPRYMDYNRPPVAGPPRRIIYYDDLSNRGKGPSSFFYPQGPSSNYEQYRGGYNAVRSPNIGVAMYRYPEQGRNYNYNGYNSILSEGTVENAPLIDDPYRHYNPRQPAPWSVQVGTSLTVKDDGRHTAGAARRYYVQSQREEPALARSLGYVSGRPQGNSLAGDNLWAAMQPRV